MTQAFRPALERSRGALVNNVSLMALAPFPVTPAYAVSKAAAFNLTQSLRALLAPTGVSVHAVMTGPTDTDMTRGFEIPKATPESVAQAILAGVETGDEEIFPDQLSAQVANHVAAVALFGNPQSSYAKGLADNQIPAINPSYSPKTIDICLPNDNICAEGGTIIAHLGYVPDATNQAATFVAQKL